MDIQGKFSAIKRWGGLGALSIADQGLSSGANFLLAVLLARWLSPSEYGAFAVAFAAHLFFMSIHTGMLQEPMSVIGPGDYRDRLDEYIRTTTRFHFALTFVFSLCLALAGLVAHLYGSRLRDALLALCVAEPFVLGQWFFRRVCYLRTEPRIAIRSSLAYAAAILAGLFAMWDADLTYAWCGVALLGLSGAAVTVYLCALLNIFPLSPFPFSRFPLSAFRFPLPASPFPLAKHWQYGKWFLAMHLTSWINSVLYLPVLGLVGGLDASASLRSMENLLLPMHQTLTALGIMIVPAISARTPQNDFRELGRIAKKIALAAGVMALGYVAIILAARGWLIPFLYGTDYYAAYAAILPYLGIVVVIRAVCDLGFGTAVRVARRPDILLWGTLGSGITTLTVGILLVCHKGAMGAAMGHAISATVYMLLVLVPTMRLFGGKIGFRVQ